MTNNRANRFGSNSQLLKSPTPEAPPIGKRAHAYGTKLQCYNDHGCVGIILGGWDGRVVFSRHPGGYPETWATLPLTPVGLLDWGPNMPLLKLDGDDPLMQHASDGWLMFVLPEAIMPQRL